MLQEVEHRFGVACTPQGGPRADNDDNVADGISALSVGMGCARADAVGTVERDGLFRHACVYVWICMCGSPAVRYSSSVTGHVRGFLSPQQFTSKAVPHKKSLPTIRETQQVGKSAPSFHVTLLVRLITSRRLNSCRLTALVGTRYTVGGPYYE